MTIFSSKRRVAAAGAVLLLVLFLLRPGASRLKSRIIFAMSAGIGRPVDIGSVHIRMLPRPGFDLENLVVYDDPEFGAEPILRASEVTAALRLTSLIRGRMEIARLDLTEPSLNLVHGESGRWNLEALLERTAHIPLAPTGKAKSEPRPGFPYIAATSGRINFKSGPEKKPYALTNADFSLWQDSENTWGVRLKAQPFRSDLNLNDTGMLQLSGTWQRAQTFRDTPVQLTVEWSQAQLGQLTKFFTGNDKGWRGAVELNIALTGTPAKLRVASSGSVDDFRRYDITSSKALHLAGNCDAEYSSLTHEFHDLLCSAPVAQGSVTLTGDSGLPGSHRFSVRLKAENVPAAGLALLALHSKKNLPDDLSAEGLLNGDFSMQEDATAGVVLRSEGRGEITDFRLVSLTGKAAIGPETVPFSLSDGIQIDFGPLVAGTGHAGNPTLRGSIDRNGYRFTVQGESDIARITRLARMVGLPAIATTADGTAQVNLQIAGSWSGQVNGAASGFPGPQVMGDAKLKNVQIVLRGTATPVEVLSADLQLSPDKARVAKLNAKAAGALWSGSMEMPRGCGAACPVRFALSANQISITQLGEWANPSPARQPWYRVLDSGAPPGLSTLAILHASGRVTTLHLQIRGVTATHASANVVLNNGKLQLSQLEAEFAGGNHRGDWQADFSVKPAFCKGTGTFSGVALATLARAMNDDWIAGTANASYEVKGKCPADFWASAEGTVRVDMQNGVLPHVSFSGGVSASSPENERALRVTRFRSSGDLRHGRIEIKDATLESPEGDYTVQGSATLTREVDLRLTPEAGGATATAYAITGTLAEPKVTATPGAEQAKLKR